ncbi:glutamate racemase [Blattabacterium cuenoti]|uniref:glutamate racemase n=1 Tax=Blattabacterium cuenoti TaxID=1653831 RepID=UPI00163BE1C7|nr:glutamate racemase [Blattabacterium cuenoti]
MIKEKHPIGIFDSGIGGLLIAEEMKKQMPNENFIYVGDTENMPYGEKSTEFIIKNSIKIVSFLYKKKCKILVIACNSITSNALDVICHRFNEKMLIYNVIDPIIKNKVLLSFKKLGIIATPATIRSNFYIRNIKKYHQHLDITQISIPFLSYFIEKEINKKFIGIMLKNYLYQFQSIDVLLLACTHYLFIKEEFEKYYHYKIHLINVQKIVVQEIKKKLNEKKMLDFHSHWNGYIIFYTSSTNFSSFEKKVHSIFGKNVFIKKHVF